MEEIKRKLNSRFYTESTCQLTAENNIDINNILVIDQLHIPKVTIGNITFFNKFNIINNTGVWGVVELFR